MYKLWIKYLLLVSKFDSTFLIKLTPHPPMSTVINKKSRCYKVHHSKTQSSEKWEMYLLNSAQTDETHLLIVYIFSQWSETERSEPHDDQSLLEQESSETVCSGEQSVQWTFCTLNTQSLDPVNNENVVETVSSLVTTAQHDVMTHLLDIVTMLIESEVSVDKLWR